MSPSIRHEGDPAVHREHRRVVSAGADLDGDGVQTEDRPDGLPMNAGGDASQANLDIINAFRRSRSLSAVTVDQIGQRYPYFALDVRVNKTCGSGAMSISS
jgi:hypothetical protein